MHHYDGNLLTAEDGNKFIAVFEISQRQQIFTAGFSPPVPDLAPTSIKLSFHDHDSLAGEHPFSDYIGPDRFEIAFEDSYLKIEGALDSPVSEKTTVQGSGSWGDI